MGRDDSRDNLTPFIGALEAIWAGTGDGGADLGGSGRGYEREA